MLNLHKSVLVLVFAALAPALLAAEEQVVIPRYPLQTVLTAPTIDGDLGDRCWAELPQVGQFLDKNGIAADQPTHAMICYDDKNIYIAARLIEPSMDKLVSNATEHDAGASNDDDFEVFIEPGSGGGEYYQFAINSEGVTEERHEGDPAIQWNGPWKSAVRRLADQWIVEIAIPFETFEKNMPAANDIWRINLCRSRQQSKVYSAWSPVPVFHYPIKFGEALFLDSQDLRKVDAFFDVKATESVMRMALEGKGRYTLQQIWTTDSTTDTKTDPAHLNGDPVVIANSFMLSTGESIGQFILTDDTTGTCVFRSSPRVLTAGDPDAIRKREIEALLDDVLTVDSPQAFDDVKRVWADAAKDRSLPGDDQGLGKLLYQVKLCLALSGAMETFADSDLVWFSEIPFTDVPPSYLPEESHFGNSISMQAMRGEYEPANLNVIPLANDAEVTVSIGDLEGPGGAVFSSDNIDIKVVKYWYQASHDWRPAKDGIGVFVREMLLNDDSMVIANHETGRNKILRTQDSKTLKPVQIERFETRQFWLTAHVPTEQKAGAYRGHVSIFADGALTAKAPIELRVLPLTMEPTDRTFTLYFNGRHTGGRDPQSDLAYENDLKVAYEHGMTSLMVQEGGPATRDKDGLVTSFDLSLMEKAVELRAKHGLRGKTAFNGGHWDYLPVDRYWRITEEEGTNNPVHKANVIGYCKEMDRLVDRYGLEGGYFAGWDEATYDNTGRKLRMSHVMYTWIKENNSKIFAAISRKGADSLGDLLDVPVFPVPTGFITDTRRTMPYPEPWFYGHPLEDPTLERFGTGVMIWYGGYAGVSHYIYQGLGGAEDKGWDDWNGIYGYRPQMYAYPGTDGPIVTVQYEGYREGCDDVKYLEMLERRVKKAQGMKLTPKEEILVATSRDLLEHPPKTFQITWREAQKALTAKDFLAFRYQVADLLVQMDELVSAASKP